MKKTAPIESPDAYVASTGGWQRKLVEQLRRGVLAAARLEEVVKWRHLVYFSNGPVLLIRAEQHRVLFGFWRGQRLREIEPALKGGGKYELATLELREGMRIADDKIKQLVRQAVALNQSLGNPTTITKSPAVTQNLAKRAARKSSSKKRARSASRRA